MEVLGSLFLDCKLECFQPGARLAVLLPCSIDLWLTPHPKDAFLAAAHLKLGRRQDCSRFPLHQTRALWTGDPALIQAGWGEALCLSERHFCLLACAEHSSVMASVFSVKLLFLSITETWNCTISC